MPTPPLLDFDELVAPIPGDDPAGGSIPFAVREKLEEFRKEVDPDQFDADDPMRPESFQKADWEGIIELAKETLTGTSKDLLIGVRLTEALVKEHGFAGLRDGLHLLLRLVAECWDRLRPAIESDDDLEIRAGPFNWLDESDRGARFSHALRMVPMLTGKSGSFGWMLWKQSQGGKGPISPEVIEQIIQAAPREECQDLVDDLTRSQEELHALALDLTAKLRQYAPSLSVLRQAVADCRTLAVQILQKKGPAPTDVSVEDGSGDGTAAGTEGRATFLGRQIGSRAQVYEQLAQAAALLQQLEPHSPIPYLIQRAVDLGAKSFPDLMKELVRDSECPQFHESRTGNQGLRVRGLSSHWSTEKPDLFNLCAVLDPGTRRDIVFEEARAFRAPVRVHEPGGKASVVICSTWS